MGERLFRDYLWTAAVADPESRNFHPSAGNLRAAVFILVLTVL
jgi:hypothetical protein